MDNQTFFSVTARGRAIKSAWKLPEKNCRARTQPSWALMSETVPFVEDALLPDLS